MSEKIENISPSIFVYFQLPTIPCNFLPFSTQTPVKYLYLSCICNWFCIWFYLGILVPDVRKSLQFAHESYSTPFPATFTAEISHSDQSLQHHLHHLLHHRDVPFWSNRWDVPCWPPSSTPTGFCDSFIFSGPQPGALIKVDAKLQEHSDLFLASDSIS